MGRPTLRFWLMEFGIRLVIVASCAIIAIVAAVAISAITLFVVDILPSLSLHVDTMLLILAITLLWTLRDFIVRRND